MHFHLSHTINLFIITHVDKREIIRRQHEELKGKNYFVLSFSVTPFSCFLVSNVNVLQTDRVEEKWQVVEFL